MGSQLLLTSSQRKFLLQKLLQEVGLNVLLLMLMVVAFSSVHIVLGILAAILVIVYYSIFTQQYWLDLHTPPLYVQASFTKHKRQVRGPPHYFLTAGAISVRAVKQQWLGIEPGITYDILYAPNTGWLLDYKRVDPSVSPELCKTL